MFTSIKLHCSLNFFLWKTFSLQKYIKIVSWHHHSLHLLSGVAHLSSFYYICTRMLVSVWGWGWRTAAPKLWWSCSGVLLPLLHGTSKNRTWRYLRFHVSIYLTLWGNNAQCTMTFTKHCGMMSYWLTIFISPSLLFSTFSIPPSILLSLPCFLVADNVNVLSLHQLAVKISDWVFKRIFVALDAFTLVASRVKPTSLDGHALGEGTKWGIIHMIKWRNI